MKKNKTLTRNIFPDLLRVLKLLLIGLSIYIGVCYISGDIMPFFGDYSLYVCLEDYPEYDYSSWDLLILKDNLNKGNVVIKDETNKIHIEEFSNRENLGTIVHNINIPKSINNILNNMLNTLKD